LSNDGAPAANITLVKVLSIPRMPGVQTIQRPAVKPAPASQVVESRAMDAIESPAEDVEIDERGSD
jgi:hypothetical protein